MADRGGKRKPSALRLISGIPSRHNNTDEPKPEGVPVMPEWLSEAAREEWAFHSKEAFWLTRADSFKLAVYCELCAELKEDVREMTSARITNWRVLGCELGLDPASRPKLSGGSRKPKTAASRFFQK